mgnify:CR=1 FL=1
MAYAITRGTRVHRYADLKDLLAKATPLRSGDALAGIAAQRQAVDALTVTPPQVIAFYTVLIGQGLGIIGEMATITRDVGIANRVAAYSSLLALKEAAGQERAVGSAAFAAGRALP